MSEMPAYGDEYLSTAEVAQLMKLPAGTIRYWRHIGEGPPAFKVGRKAVRYRRSVVMAWLTEQEKADPMTAAKS